MNAYHPPGTQLRTRSQERSREAKLLKQAETLETATARGERYSESEKHYLATTTDSMMVAAGTLGRTLYAVTEMRRKEKEKFDIRTPAGAERAVQRMMQTRDPVANPPATVTTYVGYVDGAYNCYAEVIFGDGTSERFTKKNDKITWGCSSSAALNFTDIFLKRVLDDNFRSTHSGQVEEFYRKMNSYDFHKEFVRTLTNGQNFRIEVETLINWIKQRL